MFDVNSKIRNTRTVTFAIVACGVLLVNGYATGQIDYENATEKNSFNDGLAFTLYTSIDRGADEIPTEARVRYYYGNGCSLLGESIKQECLEETNEISGVVISQAVTDKPWYIAINIRGTIDPLLPLIGSLSDNGVGVTVLNNDYSAIAEAIAKIAISNNISVGIYKKYGVLKRLYLGASYWFNHSVANRSKLGYYYSFDTLLNAGISDRVYRIMNNEGIELAIFSRGSDEFWTLPIKVAETLGIISLESFDSFAMDLARLADAGQFGVIVAKNYEYQLPNRWPQGKRVVSWQRFHKVNDLPSLSASLTSPPIHYAGRGNELPPIATLLFSPRK